MERLMILMFLFLLLFSPTASAIPCSTYIDGVCADRFEDMFVDGELFVIGGTAVGIGTTKPQTPLEVVGTAKATAIGIGTTGPASGAGIQIGSGTATTGPVLANSSSLFKTDVQVDGALYATGAKSTTGFKNLCIDSAGKVFSVASAVTCGAGT